MNLRNLVAAAVLLLVLGSRLTAAAELRLTLRTQVLRPDAAGHNQWEVVTEVKSFAAGQTAIIICDMWDKHWSRGASQRVAAMAPRMNRVVKAARAEGVTIIHCPSETMAFYKDHPARKRMIEAPLAEMPKETAHDLPPQPVDSSDGGSDTGEKPWYRAWTRQHPAIEIDEQKDGISDNGQEVWNFLKQKGVKNLVVMGVHTNMCVLGRPFAIQTMVRRGMNVLLVRDLTDAMYNPARPPYVSHEEGTRLVVQYIEKFWCPTIASDDLLQRAGP
jgi:nicotinamidase-related amidase